MADTLINGNRPSFVTLTVNLDGKDQPRGSFRSVSYGVAQEAGEVYSKSRADLVGSTPGYTKASGEFEMLVTELNQFFADLTDSGQVAITTPVFDIQVAYASNAIDVQTDKLIGVRITGVRAANQGSDATAKVCSFIFGQLVTNGIVVGGDTGVADKLLNPFAAQRQPVVSDFWYGPVYADDNGDWFCPGFLGNTYSKEPWDAVQIAVPFSGTEQPQTPGICEVMVRKYRDVDKNKKAAGTDGKRVTVHGIEPAEGDLEITIWTPQQFRMLMDLWPLLFPGPQKFTTTKTVSTNTVRTEFAGSGDSSGITSGQTFTIPQTKQTKRISTTQIKSIIRPFDVSHPKFKLLDIKSAVFVSGEGPDPGPTPFSRVFKMKWVEFLPPGKVNATTSPAAAKSSTLEPLGYQTPGSNPANSNLVG